MAEEIQDGSLSWLARIDTSELAQDVKSIATLLSSLGETNIDLSAIDNILKQQAEKEVDYRRDVAQKTISINQDIVTDAKSKADDLQKYIQSIPFDLRTGEEKLLSQSEIDAINSRNAGSGNSGQMSAAELQLLKQKTQTDLSAFSNNDTINQARDAYANADATTKQYFDDLVSLEFQLKNLQKAQIDLNASLKSGNVTEQEYLTQSSQIKTAIAGVTTELTGIKNAQSTYLQGLNSEGQATEKNITILTEYRQLRNQIASDKVKGIVNEADIDRATELEHAIRAVNNELHLASSNTAFVDAASEGVRGMVGAFSALSGVMGLFTKDNETANKIMQDTISFLGIINGLEEISQVLATNGKLNLYITGLLRKNTAIAADTAVQVENNAATISGTVVQDINAVSTEANAVAKASEATATEGATVAQEELNVAMSANPAAILLLAITAIITAYELFADNADKAAEAQKKLNDALELSKFYIGDAAAVIKRQGDNKIADMKAEGASAQAIREQELQNLKDTNDKQIEYDNQAIAAQSVASKKLADIKANDGKIAKQKLDLSTGSYYTVLVDASEKDIEELRKTVDTGRAALEDKVNRQSEIYIKGQENVAAANEDAKKAGEKADEEAKKAHEKALANDVEYWQAKVELARKGAQEWLDAQLKLNQAVFNRSLSSGQSPDKASADKFIADNQANDTVKQQSIKDIEDIVSARLDAVAKGSHDELELRLQQIELEKQSSLIAAKDNAAAIEKINAESLKKQDDLTKQYGAINAERFEEIQQNQLRIILAGLSEGTDEFVKFTKEAANQNAASAITQAIKTAAANNPAITADDISLSSVFNEKSALAFADRIESIDKDLAVKIRAIWAETDRKSQESDNQQIENLIDNKNKIVQLQADIAKEANNAIINNQNSTDTQKAIAQVSNNDIDINATDKELQNLVDSIGTKYSAEKNIIAQYIDDVKTDFTKIADLNKSGNSIAHAFDSINDPVLKQKLLELLNAFKGLTEQGKQLQNLKFDAFVKDISEFGGYIAQAGADISEMNAGLGDTISTLGNIITTSASFALSTKGIIEGFNELKKGVDSTGKALHALDYASVILTVISFIVTAISAVVKLFSQAKKTAEESAQKMHDYQVQLQVGQIKYNEELLTSKKLQDDLTQGTLDQLHAQIQLNDEKKAGFQTDLDTLTAQLAQTGQYVSGEHTEKYGGVLGIGRKTKVVQDFSSLGVTTDMTNDQIAAILKEKETLNQLTGDTKIFADEWLAVYDNISQATDASAALKEQLTEAFSGTTADDIAKSIVEGLEQGKVAAAQWGEDFNKIISNALLSSITNTLESGAVNKIWQTLQANINADGSVTPLSPEEIETLRKQYSDAVDQGNALLQQAEAIFPDLAGTLDQSSTLSGAIQGSLTEDTANELAGLWRGQYDITKQTLQVATNSLSIQQMIEANTAQALALFGAHLPMLTLYLPFLKTINDNTVPAQIKRDFGL